MKIVKADLIASGFDDANNVRNLALGLIEY